MLGVKLTRAEMTALAEMAKAMGQTMSDVVRAALARTAQDGGYYWPG